MSGSWIEQFLPQTSKEETPRRRPSKPYQAKSKDVRLTTDPHLHVHREEVCRSPDRRTYAEVVEIKKAKPQTWIKVIIKRSSSSSGKITKVPCLIPEGISKP